MKSIREIAMAWRENKRPYVKQSTMAAYMLILENHILPKFGESNELHENDVQGFVLEKLDSGLSVKSVKDILIVLKMIMKFGVKNEWMSYYEWDIKFPTDVASKKDRGLVGGKPQKDSDLYSESFFVSGTWYLHKS